MPAEGSIPSGRGMAVEKVALSIADGVIVPTESVLEKVTGSFGVNPNKVVAIPAGIDLKDQPMRPVQVKFAFPRILCVGRIQKRKNQLVLVKAIEKLRADGFNLALDLVGPIEEKAYFSSVQLYWTSRKLNVNYMGEVSSNTLDHLYSTSTLFAFPSLQETQGLVVLEAMAHGLPVVASNIGPVSDIIAPLPGAAILVTPDDPTLVANALEQLLSSQSLYNRMSEDALKLALFYDWKRIAAMYVDSLQRFLERHDK